MAYFPRSGERGHLIQVLSAQYVDWLKTFLVIAVNGTSDAMSLHTRLYRTLTDPRLRLAVIIGLVSAPITVALSWGTVLDERTVAGGTVSGTAFLVVGFLVGYLYYGRPTDRRSAGVAAGIAASTGLVIVYLANTLSTLDVSSSETLALTVIGTVIAIPIGVVIAVLIVCVAVVIGDRFAAVRSWRSERGIPTLNHHDSTVKSRWWMYVAGYVILVPVAAGYIFGINPTSIGGGLLAVAFVFITVLAAALALVAVYKDTQRLYESGSSGIPNVTAYIGIPVCAFLLGYGVASFNAWEAPAAVGQYSFLGVCWLAAVVYLLDRRRSAVTA